MTLAAVALLAGSASAASAFDGEPSDDRPIVINNENNNSNTTTNNNTNTATVTTTVSVSDLIDLGL
ncbi:hypothetical protein [Streptomyces sp. NPDC006527]|uniref:hypothetical protein n=1 Tax=Streptomyces sp. NPDC006527 TaxID=3364749 RepID=UPI0036C36740